MGSPSNRLYCFILMLEIHPQGIPPFFHSHGFPLFFMASWVEHRRQQQVQQLQLQEHLRAVWNSAELRKRNVAGLHPTDINWSWCIPPIFYYTISGWWFGTSFIFPYIGNNHPNWLILFRGGETTNQILYYITLYYAVFLWIPAMMQTGSKLGSPTHCCVSSRGLCVAQDVSSDDGEQALGSWEIGHSFKRQLWSCAMCFAYFIAIYRNLVENIKA